jgi:hypothetical protein
MPKFRRFKLVDVATGLLLALDFKEIVAAT